MRKIFKLVHLQLLNEAAILKKLLYLATACNVTVTISFSFQSFSPSL